MGILNEDSLSESSEMMSFVFWGAASTVLLMCSIFYLNRRSYLSGYEELMEYYFYVFCCVLLKVTTDSLSFPPPCCKADTVDQAGHQNQ